MEEKQIIEEKKEFEISLPLKIDAQFFLFCVLYLQNSAAKCVEVTLYKKINDEKKKIKTTLVFMNNLIETEAGRLKTAYEIVESLDDRFETIINNYINPPSIDEFKNEFKYFFIKKIGEKIKEIEKEGAKDENTN